MFDSSRPVFVVGGGPSLRMFDWSVLANHQCVLINRSIIAVGDMPGMCRPEAKKVGWWTDYRFWEHNEYLLFLSSICGVHLNSWADPTSLTYKNKIVKRYAMYPKFIDCWEFSGAYGLEKEPRKLRHGNNGGCAAVNLAWHFGARDIRLLGIDCKINKKAEDHWHNPHPWNTLTDEKIQKNFVPSWIKISQVLGEFDLKITNCDTSALECFPKKSLDDLLRA